MQIKIFPVGPFSTNCIVIESEKQCAIIDPGYGAFALIKEFVEQCNIGIKEIWLTHSHWDHIADLAQCKEYFHAKVFVHKLDAPNVKKPGVDGLPLFFTILPVEDLVYYKEGDIVSIGNVSFKVIETPGHSLGSICLYSREENLLISGDTLFAGSIGNLSLPTAHPDLMWHSLEKLAILPPQTRVIPGHGQETTIGNETWMTRAKEIFGG